MSPTLRTLSRPLPSSSTPGGTSERSHPLPTHSDLESLLATDPSLVKTINDTCKWLESKANAVASKAISKFSGLVKKLSSTADFLAANNAKCAESTLVLQATSSTLEGVTSSLDALASKLASPPTTAPPRPTWASIAKAAPIMTAPPHPPRPNFTATRSSKLRDNLNKLLDQLNLKATSLCQEDGELDFAMPTTCAIGLRNLNGSAYVTEFDTTDSACRFRSYTKADWFQFEDLLGESMETVDKAYSVIARFVPCVGSFALDNVSCLHTFELKNGLHSNSIFSALWLKNPNMCSPNQSVASLKITAPTSMQPMTSSRSGSSLLDNCSLSARMYMSQPNATTASNMATLDVTVRLRRTVLTAPAADIQPHLAPQSSAGASPAAQTPPTLLRTATAPSSRNAVQTLTPAT
ncbi:hypothetical protein C0993_005643 [Termitomyces sp. T159_Od127]|nr:hypothetical protein C0993_005643 [Termitomyces sp. T159_Od127]